MFINESPLHAELLQISADVSDVYYRISILDTF